MYIVIFNNDYLKKLKYFFKCLCAHWAAVSTLVQVITNEPNHILQLFFCKVDFEQ